MAARSQKLLRLLGEQDGMLQTRREALRKAVSPAMFGVVDEEEHCVEGEGLDVGLSVLELTSQTVRGIETALKRVKTGEYGICSECGTRIAAARLKALPFADRCRGCQEQRDAVRPRALR